MVHDQVQRHVARSSEPPDVGPASEARLDPVVADRRETAIPG
jgi:hypothetical protein